MGKSEKRLWRWRKIRTALEREVVWRAISQVSLPHSGRFLRRESEPSRQATLYPLGSANCRQGCDDLTRPLRQFVLTQRSEEHTSELQSHSFISYAVFCLQ